MGRHALLSPEREPPVRTQAGVIRHRESAVDHGLRSQFAPEASPVTEGAHVPAAGVPCSGTGGVSKPWAGIGGSFPCGPTACQALSEGTRRSPQLPGVAGQGYLKIAEQVSS